MGFKARKKKSRNRLVLKEILGIDVSSCPCSMCLRGRNDFGFSRLNDEVKLPDSYISLRLFQEAYLPLFFFPEDFE